MNELFECKKHLMDSHQKYSKRTGDEYAEGVKAGLELALMEIERMIEGYDRDMSRAYGEMSKAVR